MEAQHHRVGLPDAVVCIAPQWARGRPASSANLSGGCEPSTTALVCLKPWSASQGDWRVADQHAAAGSAWVQHRARGSSRLGGWPAGPPGMLPPSGAGLTGQAAGRPAGHHSSAHPQPPTLMEQLLQEGCKGPVVEASRDDHVRLRAGAKSRPVGEESGPRRVAAAGGMQERCSSAQEGRSSAGPHLPRLAPVAVALVPGGDSGGAAAAAGQRRRRQGQQSAPAAGGAWCEAAPPGQAGRARQAAILTQSARRQRRR
jgi:hypothetical protein